VKLDRTAVSMLRWKCSFILKEKKFRVERMLGMEAVGLLIKKGELS